MIIFENLDCNELFMFGGLWTFILYIYCYIVAERVEDSEWEVYFSCKGGEAVRSKISLNESLKNHKPGSYS